MPHDRQGQIDMGRNWVNILEVKGAGWGVPPVVVADLTGLVEAAEVAQAASVSPEATPAIRHHRDRIVAEMAAFVLRPYRPQRNRHEYRYFQHLEIALFIIFLIFRYDIKKFNGKDQG